MVYVNDITRTLFNGKVEKPYENSNYGFASDLARHSDKGIRTVYFRVELDLGDYDRKKKEPTALDGIINKAKAAEASGYFGVSGRYVSSWRECTEYATLYFIEPVGNNFTKPVIEQTISDLKAAGIKITYSNSVYTYGKYLKSRDFNDYHSPLLDKFSNEITVGDVVVYSRYDGWHGPNITKVTGRTDQWVYGENDERITPNRAIVISKAPGIC